MSSLNDNFYSSKNEKPRNLKIKSQKIFNSDSNEALRSNNKDYFHPFALNNSKNMDNNKNINNLSCCI